MLLVSLHFMPLKLQKVMPKVNMIDSHENKVIKQLSSKSKQKNNLNMKGLFIFLSVLYGSK